MNNKNLFTIIIPCKNEQETIAKLLSGINRQTLQPAKIIIADAKSTDNTPKIIESYRQRMRLQKIDGGKVAYGRNKGAEISDTKYLIFIDADMELKDKNLFKKTIELMESKNYEMATTNIRCNSDNIASDLVYILNNIGQKIAKAINSPFSTGAYMCITKEKFIELGGFDEEIEFCEDYWLSKQIKKQKFGIVKSKIYTSDRRFKKMGYWWMIKNFINSYLNRNNRSYFTKDFQYWL